MVVQQLNSYLSQIDIPWEQSELSANAYLVGGSVRDALLGRLKVPFDLDFVIAKEAIATAKKIANLHGAGFVVLDAEREIARVVFAEGTLDIAKQVGDSLIADLQRRDFTINAIAFNLHTQHLCDPLGGIADLQQKLLRMVSPANLEEDPLRLLRAYRQAAQLKFELEANTRKAINDRSVLIQTVAAERVQAELNYLFTAPQGNRWLAAATEDGLLQFWLPSSDSSKVEQLEAVDDALITCSSLGLDLSELAVLAKLATLTATEATAAEIELVRLKYSRAQIKAAVKTVQYLPQLQAASKAMSLREQYFLFLAVRDIFPLITVRAIATGVSFDIIQLLIDRYLNPQDPVAYPQPLITGNDLIEELNMKPSAIIGTILTAVQIAQIESKIVTRQQALDFASTLSFEH